MFPLANRSILVVTDLGEGSDAVVRSAAELARWTAARLHVLHIPRAPYGEPWRVATFDGSGEGERALDEQLARALPVGITPASRRVAADSPVRAIVEAAREVRPDLVMLGPHRGGPVGAHFLGTTADRMIRRADVPCMVVREPLVLPVRRIGVATDLTEAAAPALDAALAWSRWAGSAGGGEAVRPEISVLHVGWPVERVDNPGMESEVVRPRMREQIDAAVRRAGGGPPPVVRSEVLWDNDPSEAILRWVWCRKVELLAMGSHGWSGLRRALLGSLSSTVSRQATCPVLLLPCKPGGSGAAEGHEAAGEGRPEAA